jgi:uncharacterized damage-inducible protein DinB
VKVFQETELFDQEFQTEVEDAQEFLSEEELQRRREEFRDRGYSDRSVSSESL